LFVLLLLKTRFRKTLWGAQPQKGELNMSAPLVRLS